MMSKIVTKEVLDAWLTNVCGGTKLLSGAYKFHDEDNPSHDEQRKFSFLFLYELALAYLPQSPLNLPQSPSGTSSSPAATSSTSAARRTR